MIASHADLAARPLLLYGAGFFGAYVLRLLRKAGVEPLGFLDRSEKKEGMDVFGVPIRRPTTCPAGDEQPLVIVCVMDNRDVYAAIRRGLEELGYRDIIHMYDLREDEALFAGASLPLYADRALISRHGEDLAKTSALFADELSRQTLAAILAFLQDATVKIPSFPLQEQYWDERVYRRIPGEAVIDCGAFSGQVMEWFIEKHPDYRQYVAFEPDPANSQRIAAVKARLGDDPRMQIHTLALGERHQQVRLRNYVNENSVIEPDGDIAAGCVCLDDYIDQYQPTLIKIDTEGWEARVLRGGARMIRQQQPLLAVAAYHHIQDLWEIPNMVHELLPGHRLYLRSYANLMETILYAVPKERCIDA